MQKKKKKRLKYLWTYLWMLHQANFGTTLIASQTQQIEITLARVQVVKDEQQ